MAIRTGYKGWSNLEEYDLFTGNSTGTTKPNVVSDPDYVPPVYDPADCVPQEEFPLMITTAVGPFTFDLYSGSTPIIVEARIGNTVVSATTSNSTATKTLSMSASGNKIIWVRGDVGFAGSVTRGDAINKQVVAAYPNNFQSMTYIDLGVNTLVSLDLSESEALRTLRVNDNSIAIIDVTSCPELVTINAARNNISTLSLVENVDLEFLEVDDNNLFSLSLATNTILKWCLAADNNLTSVNLSNNPQVTWIRLNNNNLTSLDTSYCIGLTRLEAKNNSITSFDFSSNPLIEVMDIGDNDLTGLDISGLTNLETIYFSNNPTGNVDFTDNINVKNIQAAGNNMTAMDISVMPLLETLDITLNPIPSFSIAANDNLVSLRCGECTFTEDLYDPTDINAIIIKMDANITSGGTLHYAPNNSTGVQPTGPAVLAAYNSLVSKGTNLQGRVPV